MTATTITGTHVGEPIVVAILIFASSSSTLSAFINGMTTSPIAIIICSSTIFHLVLLFLELSVTTLNPPLLFKNDFKSSRDMGISFSQRRDAVVIKI